MIKESIKRLFRDALSIEAKGEKKWLELGLEVRNEYSGPEALDAIKDEFLDEVIFPALGDDAVRVMRADIPRTNSKEFKGASPTLQAEWLAIGAAKISWRGKAHSNYTRVRNDYAWPKADDKGPTEPRSLKTRTNEEVSALIKAHERNEQGNAEVIEYLELALKANNK